MVLYLMSLLAERPTSERWCSARSEDALFDADLRKAKVLCPGSAAFLTTVFVDDAASFAGVSKPLKDGTATAWSTCALATSHQGQALQTMVRADMQRHGLDGGRSTVRGPGCSATPRSSSKRRRARSCSCTTTTARLWGGAR